MPAPGRFGIFSRPFQGSIESGQLIGKRLEPQVGIEENEIFGLELQQLFEFGMHDASGGGMR